MKLYRPYKKPAAIAAGPSTLVGRVVSSFSDRLNVSFFINGIGPVRCNRRLRHGFLGYGVFPVAAGTHDLFHSMEIGTANRPARMKVWLDETKVSSL